VKPFLDPSPPLPVFLLPSHGLFFSQHQSLSNTSLVYICLLLEYELFLVYFTHSYILSTQNSVWHNILTIHNYWIIRTVIRKEYEIV
jgi:hypothetical protein